MRRWRDRLCRHDRACSSRRRADDPAGLGRPRAACSRSNGAPTSTTSGPDAPGRAAVHARSGPRSSACSPARSGRGTAPCTSRPRSRGCTRPATTASAPSSSATARSARPPSAPRATCPASSSPARCPHAELPACARGAPTSASRRSTRRGTRRCGSASTGRRSRSSSTWPPACRSSRRRCRASTRLVEHGREGVLYDPERSARRSTARSSRWPIRRVRRRLGAAARARVVRDFSWDAHCAALDARLRALVRRMSAPLRVLIVTDSFPPVCGGSGWSTWELARGLIGARPSRRGRQDRDRLADRRRSRRTYEGVRVTTFRRPAPRHAGRPQRRRRTSGCGRRSTRI